MKNSVNSFVQPPPLQGTAGLALVETCGIAVDQGAGQLPQDLQDRLDALAARNYARANSLEPLGAMARWVFDSLFGDYTSPATTEKGAPSTLVNQLSWFPRIGFSGAVEHRHAMCYDIKGTKMPGELTVAKDVSAEDHKVLQWASAYVAATLCDEHYDNWLTLMKRMHFDYNEIPRERKETPNNESKNAIRREKGVVYIDLGALLPDHDLREMGFNDIAKALDAGLKELERQVQKANMVHFRGIMAAERERGYWGSRY